MNDPIATLKSMTRADPNCTICYGTGEARKVLGKTKRIIISCPKCFPQANDSHLRRFPGGPVLHGSGNRKRKVWTGRCR